MKTLLALCVFSITAMAQSNAPDPYPLEQRVKNLEDRVAVLEKGAMTIGVKNDQYATYDALRDAVKNGAYATMAVNYYAAADFHAPQGFMGLTDGVYSLFPGEPMMVKRFGTSALSQAQVPVIQNIELPNVSTRTTTCVGNQCTTESSSVSTKTKLFPNAPWNK